MKLLQLNYLDGSDVEDVKESFNNLPHTNHKDGKYRLRRLSFVEVRTEFWNAKTEAVITKLKNRVFNQSAKYNEHQGGMNRKFEDIEDYVLQSQTMKEICLTFISENNLIGGQEIDVHQMRVATQEDGQAQASPEGVHQDGFDHIAMISVNRHNIRGGELLAYTSKEKDPFMSYALESGDMLMLNDRKLWHNAPPVEAIDKTESGYGDWFILCARE